MLKGSDSSQLEALIKKMKNDDIQASLHKDSDAIAPVTAEPWISTSMANSE
jgi:hypothetical protein